jgi:riboflavin kinase/FMN adenylyltransferase
MQVVWGRNSLAADPRRPKAPAVAIGNFDGVHKGHQALVAAARAFADRQKAGKRAEQATAHAPGVLTFDPHPTQHFSGKPFPLLLPLTRRLELLDEAGAEFALVEPFNAALAEMSPEDFVVEVLVKGLQAACIVVGYDFCFGKRRAGNATTLSELGRQHGFVVEVVPPVTVAGISVSSTKVRELLGQGRVKEAAALLGRPPEVTGEVVRGAGRGRGFGIPTANLAPEVPVPLATGIYAARAVILDRHDPRQPAGGAHTATYVAAVSVGTNPTFAAGADGIPEPVTTEAYLLDYPGEDLYGAHLRLFFIERLRDERRFDSVEALKAEIDRDIARTREIVR